MKLDHSYERTATKIIAAVVISLILLRLAFALIDRVLLGAM